MTGPRETGPGRMVTALSLAGLLSGLLIAGVYEATLPRIQRNRAEALRRAVFKVVPESESMQKLVERDGSLVASDDGPPGEASIYAAYSPEGKFLGYAIPGEGNGFQDTIRLIFGFDPARRQVIGMQVLESKETPGLGDKIYKDEAFVRNFTALAVDPTIIAVKHGEKTEAHQVDAITGATISSKAVVNILNASLATWSKLLPPPGQEPDWTGKER